MEDGKSISSKKRKTTTETSLLDDQPESTQPKSWKRLRTLLRKRFISTESKVKNLNPQTNRKIWEDYIQDYLKSNLPSLFSFLMSKCSSDEMFLRNFPPELQHLPIAAALDTHISNKIPKYTQYLMWFEPQALLQDDNRLSSFILTCLLEKTTNNEFRIITKPLSFDKQLTLPVELFNALATNDKECIQAYLPPTTVSDTPKTIVTQVSKKEKVNSHRVFVYGVDTPFSP